MPISVVFDTNINFSAVGWRGTPYRCLELARKGEVVSITCSQILDELGEKLVAKRGMSQQEAAEVVSEVASFSRTVEISGALRVVADDPDDDAVVECAIAGNAEYIVSGDRHLLSLERYHGIQIISARALVDLAEASHSRL